MAKRPNEGLALSLAIAVARGEKVVNWARDHDVGERAAYRLAAKPGVKAKVAALRAEAVSAAIGILSTGTSNAAATMLTLMRSEETPAAVRLNAAKAMISSLVELKSGAEIDAKFAEIQRQLKEVRATKGDKRS